MTMRAEIETNMWLKPRLSILSAECTRGVIAQRVMNHPEWRKTLDAAGRDKIIREILTAAAVCDAVKAAGKIFRVVF